MIINDAKNYRKPEHEIDDVFINRWSPRSFSEQEVPENILLSIFEAARWAPSAYNEQPWRFIIGQDKRGSRKVLFFC